MESRTKNLTQEARHNLENWSEKTKAAGQAAVESAKAVYDAAQDSVLAGAKVTDKAIRKNPYTALGIAFGAGLLLGYLFKSRK